MRSIEQIQRDLGGIPHGRWHEESNPTQPPWVQGRWESPSDTEASVLQESGLSIPEFDLSQILGQPSDLDREFLERKDREIAEHGVEALAWYVSFHVAGLRWGIYVPVSSLVYLEQRLFHRLRRSREEKLQLALNMILAHERFHFAVDYGCAQWELLLRRPCWAPLREQVMQKGTYVELEEKLANAYMLRTVGTTRPRSLMRPLHAFVKQQPAGYRDALDALDEERFSEDLRDLAKLYAALPATEMSLAPWRKGFDLAAFFPLVPEIDASQCPIYILHDEQSIGMPRIAVRFIKAISNIVETDKFKKSLSRYGTPIAKSWEKKKRILAHRVPGPPEFKKLKGRKRDRFAVRVNDSFRAHLRQLPDSETWEALDVGPHTKMGHG